MVAVAATAAAFVLGLAVLGATSQEDDDKASVGSVGGGAFNGSQVPEAYRSWVIKSGQQCAEAPAAVIAAQIEAESNWNPAAVSPVGAQGLSQFMPGTWGSWGVDADGDGKADPFTPADAIMTQGRYDCWLAKKVVSYKVKGDVVRLMLAAYNAGPGAIEQYQGIPPFPETQQYVERILSLVPKYSAVADDAGSGGAIGQRIAGQATRWIGTPYSWGGGSIYGPTYGVAQGAGTIGFDCSALVQYAVYNGTSGKSMPPRTSQAQATQGQPVNRADLQVGDIILFALNGAGDYDHVGIYTGGGQFVHAPRTGRPVTIAQLGDAYYSSKPMLFRRYR
ncbi:NlpC/P60 family protein [Streptomyces beijiangensis]|uniref:C40 family peptidase n=1 Tax=Streptomyces beijiangensis TaxID=163361 RepID=UPI0031E254F2